MRTPQNTTDPILDAPTVSQKHSSVASARAVRAAHAAKWARALPMALCLNEEELLRATWQRVPPDEVRPLTPYIAIALFVTNNHPPSTSRLGGARRARAAAALR